MAELLDILLTNIQQDPEQPRKDFNEEALQELADSIRARGVMQAISVRRTPDGMGGPPYMIIAGERRWRASHIAGMETIPAILKEGEEADSETIRAQQLTENLFREDLNPVEKAEFIQARIDELKDAGIPDAVTQVATELGVSNSWVSKATAILKVSEDIRSLARIGKIRDYSIVKKVDKLKGEKREAAIEQIRADSFNAKDFFKRKRYEKSATENQAEVGGAATTPCHSSKSPKKRKLKTVSFKLDEVIVLIERTDYRFVLEQSDPDWRNNDELLPDYLEKFKEWVTAKSESETPQSKAGGQGPLGWVSTTDRCY
jgi:ParB family transcriptional regulator, chromosome partitioning protein